MPPQSAPKTGLLNRFKTEIKTNLDTALKREVRVGPVDLPPGIDCACQLIECGFFTTKPDSKAVQANGQSAAGETYYQAVGVIMDQDYVEHKGRRVKVKGLQCRLFVPCYDTKTKGDANTPPKVTTAMQHLGMAEPAANVNVMDELRKLGATDDLFKQLGGDFEKVAAVIKKSKPFFAFKTSLSPASGQYKERIWENWNGVIPDYVLPDDGDQMIDETANIPDKSAPSANGTHHAAPDGPSGASVAGDYSDDSDLDVANLEALAKAAPNDQAAADRLTGLALKAGKTQDEVDESESWEQVVGWITGAEDEPDEEIPGVEDVFEYDTPDPKKAGATKRVKVEVKTVDEAARTVTLIESASKKPVNDKSKKPVQVPWTDLIKIG
jgi:hypothetical protein